MPEKAKQEFVTEVVEQSATEIEKKKPFAFLKRKEKGSTATLDNNIVKELDGPFKHRVTGKEFNSFVLETQSAVIQMKQDMMSFTGRMDGIGDDLDQVDKRHNKVNEATIQALKQSFEDMQQKVFQQQIEFKKAIVIYQVITGISVLAAIASFVILIVK